MNEKTSSTSFWNEAWNLQNKFFLHLCKMNSNLFQDLQNKIDQGNADIDWNEWFKEFENHFNQNSFKKFSSTFFKDDGNTDAHYQEIFNNYYQKLLAMERETLDLFKERIMKASLKNAREVYEIWLQSCEQIYEKMLMINEYQDVYSKFINMLLGNKKNI